MTGGGSSFLEDIWNEKYNISSHLEEDDNNEDSSTFKGKHCHICERIVKLTKHHLIPKESHKTMLKKGCDKDILNKTIPVCRLCHSTIHRFFSNEELADDYNTVDKLLNHEKFFKYAKWANGLSDSRYSTSATVK